MLYALVFTPAHRRKVRQAHVIRRATPRRPYMASVKKAVSYPKTVLSARRAAGRRHVHLFALRRRRRVLPECRTRLGLLYVHARGNLSLAEMDRHPHCRGPPSRLARHQVRLHPCRPDAAAGKTVSRGRRRRDPVRIRRLARAQACQRHSTICASRWPAFPASTSRCAGCPDRQPETNSASHFAAIHRP